MGNQEKAGRETLFWLHPRAFFRVGLLLMRKIKKVNLYLLHPSRRIVTILGRTPSVEEYKSAVEGIDLTKFAPPAKA